MTESKKKILIVDDEADLVELLQVLLEQKGYEVFTAFDGQEGLDKVKEKRPDLVVLDVMMPKMDGYQMCRLLKFDEELRQIPVILLTARGQERDKKTGRDVGADDYMTKPFENAELLQKISAFFK